MERFSDVSTGHGVRRSDHWGSGHYGAGRGNRTHRGVDFAVSPGDEILAPIDGDIVRMARPYADDSRYEGIVIKGTGPWDGIEVRIFYVEGYGSGAIKAGDPVGRAQNLQQKYPGIGNHVHLEVREGARILSPDEAYCQCLGSPR